MCSNLCACVRLSVSECVCTLFSASSTRNRHTHAHTHTHTHTHTHKNHVPGSLRLPPGIETLGSTQGVCVCLESWCRHHDVTEQPVDTHTHTHTHTQRDRHKPYRIHAHTEFILVSMLCFRPCVSPPMRALHPVAHGGNVCSTVCCVFWWPGSQAGVLPALPCATLSSCCVRLHVSASSNPVSAECSVFTPASAHPCVRHSHPPIVAFHAQLCAADSVGLTLQPCARSALHCARF